MTLLRVLYSVIIVLLAGWAITSFKITSPKKMPFAARLALNYLAGSITISLFMFLLSVVGLRMNGWLISAPFILFLLYKVPAMIEASRKIKIKAPKLPPLDLETAGFYVIFLTLFLLVLAVFANNYYLPVYRGDPINVWTYKAKILFFNRYVPWNVLMLGKVVHTTSDYPLLIMLNLAWVAICSGYFLDTVVRAFFSVQYLATIVFLYYSLKDRTGKLYAISAAMIVAACPMTLIHVENAYADVSISSFVAVSIIFLHKWMLKKDVSDLVLAGIFIGGAAWTKNDGIGLFAAMLASFIVYAAVKYRKKPSSIKTQLMNVAVFALSAFVVFVPYKIVTLNQGIGNHMVKGSGVFSLLITNSWRIPAILAELSYNLFLNTYLWLYFWIIFIVIMAANWKKLFKTDLLYLFLFILFSIGVYCLIFVVTPLEFRFHMVDAMNRLLLGLVFPACYIMFDLAFGKEKAE